MSGGSERIAPGPETPAPGPEDPADSIERNAAFGLAVKLAGALFTGALTLFLVRALEPDGYGVFALATSIGSLVLLFSDFGISQSSARYIAERRGRHEQVGHVLGDALSLKLGASLLVSVLLAALAVPIAEAYDSQELVWPLRLVSLAVFAQSVMALFAGSFEALGRNSLGFRLALSESAVECGASVALVLLGTGVGGAVGGRAIGYAFGALLGFALVTRLIRPGSMHVGLRARWGFRPIATYAGALLIVEGAFALYTEIDTLIIGAVLGTTAAGFFAAPLKLLVFSQYPGLALAAGIAPRLARHPDHPPNVGALQGGLRLLVLVQFALAVTVVVWARPLVDLLLGDDYGASVEPLRLLAPFVLIGGITPLLALSVNYLGEARRRIPLAVATVAINAGLDLWLINAIGIKGASVATDVAVAFYAAGHLLICARVLELSLWPLALSVARAALAAVAMGLVLFAFGTGSLGVAEMAAGAVSGTLAYVAVLALCRELTRSDLALLRERFGAALGR